MIRARFLDLALFLMLAACSGDEETKTTMAPPPSLSQTVAYDCSGVGRVTAVFTTEDKTTVQVALPDGKSLTLLLVRSASGARYGDAAGNELWSKGNEAMLTMGGKTASCAEAPHLHP